MRHTVLYRYKMPKNMGVAPRFDVWSEQYEPWQHMKRMGRLVGTGFYIPPEWYNHFRMFPPLSLNFSEERTLNPHNAASPTQSDTDTVSASRRALRAELANKSRLVASEGMRYYNIFWVRKPLDRMEKAYYDLQRRGVTHAEAIRRVLADFYAELAVKKRTAALQAEEAKRSGRFITMREATVVLGVLAQLHREQLTPHQVARLARQSHRSTREASGLDAAITRVQTEAEADVSAEALAEALAEDHAAEGAASYRAEVRHTGADSVPQMRETAMDGTGEVEWYTGIAPTYDSESEAEK